MAVSVDSFADARALADEGENVESLDDLDEQIISMILCRVELARIRQSTRRSQGLPARELAHENAVLRRYVARLGRRGAELAGPVLSLSYLSDRSAG